MAREKLLERVKQTILQVDSSADVILYGSRARGEAHPESDWDFLILVNSPVNEDYKRMIRHRLYDIEWSVGEVISSIIHSREEWNQPLSKFIPFREKVRREGILI